MKEFQKTQSEKSFVMHENWGNRCRSCLFVFRKERILTQMSTSLGRKGDERWIQFGRERKRTFVKREKTFVVWDFSFLNQITSINFFRFAFFFHFELTIIETGLRSPAGRPEGHRLLWIVNASMVMDRCFVWTTTKFLLPELYLWLGKCQSNQMNHNMNEFTYL